jgi:hypothetical protein
VEPIPNFLDAFQIFWIDPAWPGIDSKKSVPAPEDVGPVPNFLDASQFFGIDSALPGIDSGKRGTPSKSSGCFPNFLNRFSVVWNGFQKICTDSG